MDTKNKTCRSCSTDKPLTEYPKLASSNDGYNSLCKSCKRVRDNIYYNENRLKVREWQSKYRKGNEKDKERRRAFYWANREMILQKQRVTFWANKEAAYEARREWYRNNKEKINEWTKERQRRVISATPTWANKEKIGEIYRQADFMRQLSGMDYEVDHIVPITSKIVCGLHCEHNLQIITAEENMKKKNLYWPDMPEYVGALHG